MKQFWLITFTGLLLAVTAAQAQFTYTTNNGSLTVIGPPYLMGAVTIPATYNGLPVTAIASQAFANGAMTSVSIPGSVTNIGAGAFTGCPQLNNLSMTYNNVFYSTVNGVLYDGTEATLIQYAGDPGIAYTVPSSVKTIAAGAFEFGNLTSVTIPVSVTNIGAGALAFCPNLTGITVASGNPVYSSASGVLFDASQDTLIQAPGHLAGNYTLPASITNIVTGAFAGCPSLSEFTVGTGNAYFSTVSSVLFNKNQTTLLMYPPAKTGTPYAIPATVTNVAGDAFYGASLLTNITLSAGVLSIGDGAFLGCTGLKTLSLPGTVTSLGNYVFENCASLTNITLSPNIPSIGTNDFGLCFKLAGITLPAGITNIGDFAFDNCTNLPSITIPGSVVGIGQLAFYNCENLTNATITNGVTGLGYASFFDCVKLPSLTFPASVNYLGPQAFLGCTSLASVYFLGNAPVASTTVFAGDTGTTLYYLSGASGWSSPFGGVTTLLYPFNISTNNGTISINSYTGASNAVTIPAISFGLPVTAIAAGAFQNVQSLTGVTMPNSLTNIGAFAFQGCDGLTNLTVPAHVNTIGIWAFSNCRSLTNLTVTPGNAWYSSVNGVLFNQAQTVLIQYPAGKSGSYIVPNGVTSIGNQAFDGSTRLTSVTIPATVTNISDEVFQYCINLTNISVTAGNPVYDSVNGVLFGNQQTTLVAFPAGLGGSYTVPAGVTNIMDYAFSYCFYLTTVTFPASLTSLEWNAFFSDGALTAFYFAGHAPFTAGANPFVGVGATVYYLPGTTGWSDFLANTGLPQIPWNAQAQTGDGNFGMQNQQFGFNITGTSNLVAVVEACTNLASPVWSPLQTVSLTNGTYYFSEPFQTNTVTRFYQVSMP